MVDNLHCEIRGYLKNKGYAEDDRFYGLEAEYLLKSAARGEKLLKVIERYIPLNLKNKKVLDCGCGCGGVAIACAKKEARVFGVDLDEGRLKLASNLAKKEKTKVILVIGDLNEKIFKPSCFDIIFAIDILEHVNCEKLIKNLFYYTKKGGILIFKVNNKLFPFDPHTKMFFIHYLPAKLVDFYLRRFYPNFFKDYKSYGEVHLPTYLQLKKILRRFLNLSYTIHPTGLIWAGDIRLFKSKTLNNLLVTWPFRIINQALSNKLLTWFSQSWIIVSTKK